MFLAFVAHLEGFAVVALAFANVARNVDVGEEMHLHLDDAVALAGFATTAPDVEAEPPGPVAPGTGFLGLREQFANRREHPGVGGRVGPRRPADGALVDIHHLVEVVEAHDVGVGLGRDADGAVQRPGRDRVESVVDQRGLSRAGHAGDAGQQPDGKVDGYVAQVVAACLDQRQYARLVTSHSNRGHRDGPPAGQVLAGDGLLAFEDIRKRSGDDDLAAMHPGPGSDVDDVVGGPDRLLVVLDDQHGIAEIP